MNKRILIVEDDRDLAALVRLTLEDHGHAVQVAADGEAGLQQIAMGAFDLLILDLMLPGVDGLEICRRVRAHADYTPILILTAKDSEVDRVLGLELGADDYLTKPVSMREIAARVKALTRRAEEYSGPTVKQPEAIERGALRIDIPQRKVAVDGEEVSLTAKEFDLLAHFAAHPGRVYTRRELLDTVWGYGYDGYEHTVNSHINRLRTKIEADASEPHWILTVWGVGYKFREEGVK